MNKAILLVRNPFDSILSFWNLMAGSSHTTSLPTELFTTYADIWAQFIEHETGIWRGFHDYWLETAAKQIPILLIRYEDILANRDVVTRQMIEFLGEKRASVDCLLENSRNATLYKVVLRQSITNSILTEMPYSRATRRRKGKQSIGSPRNQTR